MSFFVIFQEHATSTNFINHTYIFTYNLNFSSSYKSRDEFVDDVRQIFNNCEVFNEDDSPVGKAGHEMRKYFELRWVELTDQNNS